MGVKNMPYWLTKTKQGFIICTICGSLAAQPLYGWACSNQNCEKHHHDDKPHTHVETVTVTNSGASPSPSEAPSGTATTTTT